MPSAHEIDGDDTNRRSLARDGLPVWPVLSRNVCSKPLLAGFSVCNPGSSFTHSTEDQMMDRQHVGMCTSFLSRYFLLKERRDVQVLKAD